MAIFAYRTATRDGVVHEGVIEAEDRRAAGEKLRDGGFILLSLHLRKEGLRDKGRISFRSRQADLLAFTTELSALLNAGLPLDRALHIVSDVSERPFMRRMVQDILRSIREGSSFSDALQRHPKIFPKLYSSMVRAGEAGGILQNVLERLSEFLESSKELRDHVISAMIYPAILTVTGIVSVLLLFAFVLPRFSAIFTELGAALPLPTQILLAVSGAVRSASWLLFAVAAAGAVAARAYVRTEAGRLQWDRIKLALWGDVLVKRETARFCRTLGALLSSGVPLLQALKNARDVMGNQVLASAIDGVVSGAKEGKGIAEPLARASVLPALALSMIKVGEETGQLNVMLTKIAVLYEKSLREAIKRFVSFLEPALILCMGLVIGFIVVSMLLAIFSITDLPL